MKKVLLIIAVLALGLGANAQDERAREDVETLFSSGTPVGGFVGVSYRPMELNGQAGVMAGGEAAIVLGHQLNIGFAGYGLLTDINSNYTDVNGNTYLYELGYGGLKLEPVIASHKMIHVTVPVLLGAGGATIARNRMWDYSDSFDWDTDVYDSDVFLVAEPGVNVEVNLFKILRLDAGVSYRFVNDVTLVNATNNSMSGFSGNVTLKLGWF